MVENDILSHVEISTQFCVVQSHQTMTYMAPNFMSLHATRLVNFLRLEIILNIFESQYHIK